MNNLVEIGKIIAPFGLKGEFKIVPKTYDFDQYFNFTELTIFGYEESFEIKDIRVIKNQICLKLNGIDSIAQAEKLVGLPIYANEDEFKDNLEEDEFLVSDLVGLDVFIEDSQVGTVKDVLNGPAQDVLVITNKIEETMVPFVRQIVKSLDIKNNRIYISKIEGLIPWI
ncbi:MAG: ribosome maturation factor RimM [Ezakiella sp.]|nr:ribosome maturation factor RimM [Ezakiella sp.]MDD7471559.1 ribosome maturation factor RimM [Bacillota bacterium]MDY3922795.1 ribosome maturation factor RimM [Ezakiella sp.]